MSIKEISRYFFIDYENVNKYGLNGISELKKKDCVRIYYSDSAGTITFDLHLKIIDSKARFKYYKIQMPIKNAVDCQILFDIQDLTKENKDAQYFIVSNDTDFDKAIKEFKDNDINIKKISAIQKIDTPDEKKKETSSKKNKKKQNVQSDKQKREAQIRSFCGQHFKKKNYLEHKEELVQAILKGKSRMQINNNLMKIFPSETVAVIFKTIQPLIKNLPGK